MTNEEYKALREKIGTQDEVSVRLGIDVRTLHRRETGQNVVSTEAELAITRLAAMTTKPLPNRKPWPKDIVSWYNLILTPA